MTLPRPIKSGNIISKQNKKIAHHEKLLLKELAIRTVKIPLNLKYNNSVIKIPKFRKREFCKNSALSECSLIFKYNFFKDVYINYALPLKSTTKFTNKKLPLQQKIFWLRTKKNPFNPKNPLTRIYIYIIGFFSL